MNKKGIVLVVVLATILVVIVLANVILGIISNQARLTHHQISRMQAYYAAQAGMNLAMENLRNGTWTTPGTHTLCSSGCDVTDTNIPYQVSITISAPDATGVQNISITTTYTYTP